MLLIRCPWCGERHQSEFAYGGEAHVLRPPDPAAASDETWADYLFTRANPKGCHHERWFHRFGCRRWFFAVRHTVSDRFWAFYEPGAAPPTPPDDWNGTVSVEEYGKPRRAHSRP